MLDPEMDGWIIVVTNGLRLVGRCLRKQHDDSLPSPNKRYLKPVYELTGVGLLGAPGPNVPPQVRFAGGNMVIDVLGLDSLRFLAIPEDAIVIPLRDLSGEERGKWRRAIDGHLRSKEHGSSGLVLPSAEALNDQVRKLVQ